MGWGALCAGMVDGGCVPTLRPIEISGCVTVFPDPHSPPHPHLCRFPRPSCPKLTLVWVARRV